MSDDLFAKIKSYINEQKAQGGQPAAPPTVGPPAVGPPAVGRPAARPPAAAAAPPASPAPAPAMPPPAGRVATPPPAAPAGDAGLGALVSGGAPPAPRPAPAPAPAPVAQQPANAGLASLVGSSPNTANPKGAAPVSDNRLPSNATLDDLINFAKAAKQKKETVPPGQAKPAIPTALPPIDDDLPDVAIPIAAPAPHTMAGKRPSQAMPDLGDLPDIDDDLTKPLEPLLDVDRILAEKKKKDQMSIKKLFTMEYLPPSPRSIEETGLEPAFLAELMVKVIYYATELEGLRVAEELALPFSGVVEPILRQLKDENILEIKGGGSSMAAQWRFQITHKGVEKAQDILQRNGYYGPAPVNINYYTDMVHRQRVSPDVTLKEVKAAFSDMILNEATLEKIGPAVNSAKSAFLYGPPGNGKTSICERMCSLLGGAIFVPYALEVGGQVIKLYDNYVHRPPQGIEKLNLTDGELSRIDRRWVICERPIVIVGGELTLEMLDLTYNEAAKFYEAPFQVKSNGGMLLIDDFGRQKVRPTDLLNRWIVPLEKNIDFLTLHTGKKCEIPFDQFIVFSTNLDPSDLVDEAFLRRLRYKIEIEDPSVEEYIEIFKRTCAGKGVKYQSSMMKYLLENYYLKEQVAFRACHPRDLLDQVIDRAKYRKIKPQLTPELLDHAWKSYFVKL